MEWGVISNGGHMNIFNSNELLGWEYNSSNQLIADTLTTKTPRWPLYFNASARLDGQFNHPSTKVANSSSMVYPRLYGRW